MTQELPITEADLQACADGRLAEGRRAEVETWLAGRPEESERIEFYRRASSELRELYGPVLEEPVPERLAAAARRRRRFRGAAVAAGWLVLGIALGGTAGGIAGWQLHGTRSASLPLAESPTFVRRAALAHATYTPEVRHAVEVSADQEAHLVAWLSKRLGGPVRAPKLGVIGYDLVGGRLLPSDGGPKGALVPSAHFMYQNAKGMRITLYVRAELAGNTETAFRYAREGNVSVFYWIDRKFAYALSSNELGREDLLKVANAVYQQLNP
jgi:anti-sigma factor RsiW